jgi:hypothetical protein
MTTFRLVCALAVVAEIAAGATMAMTVMCKILFRPMAMIDPLVMIRLLMICG